MKGRSQEAGEMRRRHAGAREWRLSGRETVKTGGGAEVRMMDEGEERERERASAPRRTDKGTGGRVNM